MGILIYLSVLYKTTKYEKYIGYLLYHKYILKTTKAMKLV